MSTIGNQAVQSIISYSTASMCRWCGLSTQLDAWKEGISLAEIMIASTNADKNLLEIK